MEEKGFKEEEGKEWWKKMLTVTIKQEEETLVDRNEKKERQNILRGRKVKRIFLFLIMTTP